MKPQIHVIISPAGEITVEAHGYQGKGCEAATKAIELALGTTLTRTFKPEHRRAANATRPGQRLGEGGGSK